MREFQIRLRSVQDVQEFVNRATERAFTVLVGDGHHQVDGKCFMEMFCLNFTQPLTATAECSEAEFDGFCADLYQFLVK